MCKIVKCIDDSDLTYEEIKFNKIFVKSFVNFYNINIVVKDLIKTLKNFDKNNISVHKTNKTIVSKIAKIVVSDIFARKIKLCKHDVVYLLDFVGWNCTLMFSYADDWASCEEDAGRDIIKLLDLAKKNKRQITEYRTHDPVYCLLMAVYDRRNKDAEKFIIKKKIKLTDKMINSRDGMIASMIEYFSEKNYDLLK